MSQYTDAIKRIVGYDDIIKQLKELKEKVILAGQRGVGFQGPSGDAKGTSGGTGGSNNPATTPSTGGSGGASNNVGGDAVNDALGPYGNNPNGDSPSTTPGGGGHVTASQLADGGSPATGSDGGDPDPDVQPGASYGNTTEYNSNVNTAYGADGYLTIKSIDYHDCTTGKQVSANLDGFYRPPVGFFTPDEGQPVIPEDVGWYLGYRFAVQISDNPVFYFSTLSDAINGGLMFAQTLGITPPLSGESELLPGQTAPSPSNTNGIYRYLDVDGNTGETATVSCLTCSVGVDAACTMVPPNNTIWPESDQTQVANTDGTWQPHPLDPNHPPLPPSSNLQMCFGDGRTGELVPTNGGGYAFYETSGAGGPVMGVVTYIASDGAITGYGDAASLNYHRPTVAEERTITP